MEDIVALQNELFSYAIEKGALRFGSFTLKSGRVSPYFLDSSKLYDGSSLLRVGFAYAQCIKSLGIEKPVLFGPAYKGIFLATTAALGHASYFGEALDIATARKEAKDHGEGGVTIGTNLEGRNVIIINDVITAGTAIRESVQVLTDHGANLRGVVVLCDRQERSSDNSPESAVQNVEKTYGIQVKSVFNFKNIYGWLHGTGETDWDAGMKIYLPVVLDRMDAYYAQYGIAQ